MRFLLCTYSIQASVPETITIKNVYHASIKRRLLCPAPNRLGY